MDMRRGEGWRYLIQNGLYRHVQDRTAPNSIPILHPLDGEPSLLLAAASVEHRQARDEMGKLHWRLNNHFQHHGERAFMPWASIRRRTCARAC